MEIFHYSHFIFLIFSSIFFTSFAFLDPISNSLLIFKSNKIDDSNSLNDWSLPSTTFPSGKIYACSWSCVTCNKNSTKLTGLDLSNKNLGGEISNTQFDLFIDLLHLNISYNSFSGELPVGIFNLTSLRILDFSRNNFSGEFPRGISNLKQLVVLDAFSNSFSGELPADVSEIRSLKVVNFAGSYFSGPIPREYGSFSSLEFIHLAGNYLSGSIPPELGRLKTLTHMEIGYNSYEGGIPWQFGNMSELQYLDIAGANLSGNLPNELSNLTKLDTLFLFRNKLTGLIPYDLGKIKNLTSLDLSDNFLSGQIPESLSELKNLRLLSLMYNDMSGSVPESLSLLPSLETLLVWSNFFNGSLPKDLGRHSKLKWVDVSTNNFEGSIPPAICASGELTKLILFSNNFSGGLSPSISNCSSLVRLRIEDNSFSGDISLDFTKFQDISYIDLSQNRFTGGIPDDIVQASNLQYFNVSNNLELGGKIPEKTWSLPLIQNFSASFCNISGNIPPFHSCPYLYVLELNTNNISGTLPKSIDNCESMKLLNVSFNDISGSIPSENAFKSMSISSFFGNPKLCGAPLRPCRHEEGIPNDLEMGSKRTQRNAWALIVCGVVVLILAISLFGVFYFRKGNPGQWAMVSFSGLPQFTANDILRSFNSIETLELVPTLSGSVSKAVLPTGIIVLVRRIEWEPKTMMLMLEFINQMGNVRHNNLIRLLGCCYNKNVAFLLYDHLPNGNLAERIGVKRDWPAKYKIVIGIAKGLCFLHHDCLPAIAHGELRATNIVLDENMEPHLTDYGFKHLAQLNGNSVAALSRTKAGEFSSAIYEELYADIYNFGEIIMEIITNGKSKNAGETMHGKPKEALLREIFKENEYDSPNSLQEEIKVVTEVALRCTITRQSDRPSMKDVLKLLSGLKQ